MTTKSKSVVIALSPLSPMTTFLQTVNGRPLLTVKILCNNDNGGENDDKRGKAGIPSRMAAQ